MNYTKLTVNATIIANVFSGRELSKRQSAELLLFLEQHFNNLPILHFGKTKLGLRVHLDGNTITQENLK